MTTSECAGGAQSSSATGQKLTNHREFAPQIRFDRMRHELQMMRYTNWALLSLQRSHLTYGAWDNAWLAPRINLAPVFSQPNFLVPASVQKTWEVKYNAKQGGSWNLNRPNRFAEENAWDRDRDLDRSRPIEDLLRIVMKVPEAKQAQHELQWKVQLALDRAWHNNPDLFPAPQGPGIKFPSGTGGPPAGYKFGSSPAAHLRRHAWEFVEDNPNRAILLAVAVGYTGYVAGMHINPDIPQWLPEIPLAVPGTNYRIPGMSLRINYINDFRGTVTRPLEVFDHPRSGDDAQEFRATIQVDVNELLRLFDVEPSRRR